LSKYFDTIPHSELLRSVARRISDGEVVHLLKMWLTVAVEERDEKGNRILTGGQSRGTPLTRGEENSRPCQRIRTPVRLRFRASGVVSPLLANLYMNRFLKHWRRQGKGEQYRAYIVNYADDFVILSRGKAAEALEWTQAVMTRLGLTLNEQKTCIRNARQESFDFLGYTGDEHFISRYLSADKLRRASSPQGQGRAFGGKPGSHTWLPVRPRRRSSA
jgi:RNA-directed DNA polymerase